MKKVLLLLSIVAIIFIAGCFDGNSKNISGDINDSGDQDNSSYKKSLKEIEDRDWVYDADYTKEVKAKSYSTSFGTYSIDDIVVPYVNIFSSDVINFNGEIKQMLNYLIFKYNEGVENSVTYIDECGYKFFLVDDKFLSVIHTYGIGGTDVVSPSYVLGCFDVNTGKKVTFEEAYKEAGFSGDKIEDAIYKSIENVVREQCSGVLSEDEMKAYIDRSNTNFDITLRTNTLKFYLTEDKKLVVLVNINIPAGKEYFDTLIEVK